MNNISQIWAQPAQQDFGTPQPARPAKFRCKIPSTFDECQKDAAFHGLWPVKKALFQGFYQTSDEYLSSPLLRTPTKWSIDLKNCSLFHPVDIHSDLFFVVKYKTRMTMFIVQLNWHPADAQLNMEKKIQGAFFNCSAQISVLKRKTLFNQRGSFVHREFHGTEFLIGCPSFFILVLKIGRNS